MVKKLHQSKNKPIILRIVEGIINYARVGPKVQPSHKKGQKRKSTIHEDHSSKYSTGNYNDKD